MVKILLLVFLASISFAGSKTYGNATISEVTSIYDGDTFRVNIEGWPDIVGKRIVVRINGIDAPEMRGKCQEEKRLALQAKQFVVEKLRDAKTIEIRNMRRGKYFRIIADVFVDGKDLGEEMKAKHYAVEYHGGHKKMDWCRR